MGQSPPYGAQQNRNGCVGACDGAYAPFYYAAKYTSVDADVHHANYCRYPLDAVREALVNALIHRDWTRALEVEAVNYEGRLEITSPGALQNSMTLKKMLAGQRSPRNPIIVDVMRDYGYVEAHGMGVRRKIVPLTRQYTGKDARFLLADDFLRVIIPAVAI